jgi:exopolysaccharide biosynthesis polyprenyl glycosylphosphotransferase
VNDKNHLLITSLQKLFDLVLLVLSFGLTTALIVHNEGNISLTQFLSIRTKISDGVIFLLALFICHLIFSICGLYRSMRLSSKRAELKDIAKATTLSVVCFVAIGSAFNIRMITLPFLALFWVISTSVLCAFRLSLRIGLARIRAQGRNSHHMLILGTNPRAVEFARRIVANPERGYRLLGFVDDEWAGMAAFRKGGLRLVSDYGGLAGFLRSNVVDEVAIFLPVGSFYRYSADVAALCEQHGIIMRINADIFGLKSSRWRTEEFDDDHFMATYPGTGEGWPLFIKRALDISISILLLLVLAPLLAAVALAVKLTSPGPVFFRQERIGLNKRRFRICKFRTMVPNAEKMMAKLEHRNEVSGPVFKIKNDPRITSIGKFLRKSSIDELPQLFNVLKGDMSIVGPRPMAVRDFDGFNEDWQRRRFSVRPGITCLWQVNGRSSIPFDQWMRLDLQYMDEWSLWLDLKIMAKTVPAVFRGAGAA